MNLQKLAAKDNLFLINEIPQKYFENEYFTKNFEHYKTKENYQIKELPDFIKNNDNLESGLFFEVSTQLVNNSKEVDLYYIEHCYWLVKHKDFTFYTILTSSCIAKGKIIFQLPYSFYRSIDKISNDLKNNATKNILSPSKIGVFTDKKILDWFTYLNTLKISYENLQITVNEKNSTLQSEIDNFITSLKENCKVTVHSNRTYVDTPLFNVIFELFKEQNYLSKKIEFKGGLNDIISINTTHKAN